MKKRCETPTIESHVDVMYENAMQEEEEAGATGGPEEMYRREGGAWVVVS